MNKTSVPLDGQDVQRWRLDRVEQINAEIAQLTEDKRIVLTRMQVLPDPDPDGQSEYLTLGWAERINLLEAECDAIDLTLNAHGRRRDALLVAMAGLS